MTASIYQQIALDWSPESQSDKQFKLITVVVLIVMLLLAVILGSIDVPKEERQARQVIPERIANILLEKKKARKEIKKPAPKAKPKPKPKKEKPKVKKIIKDKKPEKPLTQVQKKARAKAEESGLIALSNELSDLMDTSDISAMVGGEVKSAKSSSQAHQPDKKILLANANQGSGGVDNTAYTTKVGKTKLSKLEIASVKQSLVKDEDPKKVSLKKGAVKRASGGVRAEEDVTLIFDQNKSKLYSLYNRARRKNPGLKGKIILQITISPAGKVANLKVVSSELNDKDLESKLIKRIRGFNFGAKNVKQLTVIYPIEFLPS